MKSRLKQDGLLFTTYVYLFLPLLLFIFSWLRLFLAIPLGILLIYAVCRAFLCEKPLWKPTWSARPIWILLLAVAITLLWVLSSGIGGATLQYPDHAYRNAVFKALVDSPWPVRLETSYGDFRGLTYYIGFWLPAAVTAKITSSYAVGLVFQQIWAVIGLFLIWYFICERQGKWHLWYLVVFIFFGGLDPIGRLITGGAFEQVGNRYEWWAAILNFSGMSTHLFWIYQQVIYAWLFYCLLMRQKENSNLILLWGATLLYCPVPGLGMLPFVVYRGTQNAKRHANPSMHTLQKGRTTKSAATREPVEGGLLSLQNLIGAAVIVVLAAYLFANDALHSSFAELSGTANATAEESAAQALGVFNSYSATTQIWIYLWFILLEIGIYYLLLYKTYKHRALYWISLITLLICPWIRIGHWADMCRWLSIPALFCLYEMVVDALQNWFTEKKWLPLSILTGLLGIAAITTGDSLAGVMGPANLLLYDNNTIELEVADEIYVSQGENFSGDNESFFFRYLARPRNT